MQSFVNTLAERFVDFCLVVGDGAFYDSYACVVQFAGDQFFLDDSFQLFLCLGKNSILCLLSQVSILRVFKRLSRNSLCVLEHLRSKKTSTLHHRLADIHRNRLQVNPIFQELLISLHCCNFSLLGVFRRAKLLYSFVGFFAKLVRLLLNVDPVLL